MIGLYILGAIFTAILMTWLDRRGDDAGFNAAILKSPFRSATALPAEWPGDLGEFVARSGMLVDGRPPALLLVGYEKSGSVVIAGAATNTLVCYLGFAFPEDWGLSDTQRAELMRLAKPEVSRFLGTGALVLLWRGKHTAANLRALVDTVRRDVLAVAGAAPAAVQTTAPAPEPVSPPVEAAAPTPVTEAAAPAAPPDDTFCNDNMWGWRKEGDMGYATLPMTLLPPHVRRISLGFHEIAWLTSEIGLLEDLEEFTLYNTQLDELPEEIGKCLKLRTLSITQSKLGRIPASVFGLPQLEVLCLNCNEIEVLPEEVGRLSSLRELNLNGNGLQEIPESVGNLEKLELLAVACGRLKTLPESIAGLRNLRELVFYQAAPVAAEIEKWKAALPNTKVRLASSGEIARNG